MANQAIGDNTLISRFRSAPDDTLLHIAEQLSKSGETQRLYKLILDDPAWMEAKAERFGDDKPFLKDLQIAIQALPEQLDAQAMARLLSLHALREVASNRAESRSDTRLRTMVSLGEDRRALSYARLRPDANGRLQGLMVVFHELELSGIRPRQLLHEARRVLAAVNDRRARIAGANDIAVGFASVGAQDTATALLAAAWSELADLPKSRHDIVFTNAAMIIATTDKPLPAPVVVTRLGRPLELDRLRCSVIQTGINIGAMQEAYAWIKDVASASVRVHLWVRLARALSDIGDVTGSLDADNEAWQSLLCIDDAATRAYAACVIASYSGSAEHLKAVFDTAISATIDAALSSIEAAKRFEIGRSSPVDRCNAIVSIENLGAIVTKAWWAHQVKWAQHVLGETEQLLAALPKSDTSDANALLGEVPYLYVQEFLGKESIWSEPRLGRSEDAHLAILVAYASVGEFGRARSMLDHLKHPAVSRVARYRLARVCIGHGRWQEALGLVLDNEHWKGGRLHLVETPDGSDFAWTTHFNHDTFTRSSFDSLTHIKYLAIERLSTEGRLDEACAIEGHGTDPEGRAENSAARRSMLELLALAFARSGQSLAASNLLAEADRRHFGAVRDDVHTHAILRIIELLAASDELELAGRLVDQLDVNWRLVALGNLSRMPASRHWAGIRHRLLTFEKFQAARPDADAIQQSAAFAALTRAYADTGDDDDARRCLARAVEFASTIQSPLSAVAARPIAEAAHAIGDAATADTFFHEMLQATSAIVPRWEAIPLLLDLGEVLQSTGRRELADFAFERVNEEVSLRYPLSHCGEIVRVLPTLIRTKRLHLAVRFVSMMPGDRRYLDLTMRATEMIIPELLLHGLLEEAKTLAFCLDYSGRARTLCSLAVELHKAGFTSEAEGTLDRATKAVELIGEENHDQRASARANLLYARSVVGGPEHVLHEIDDMPPGDIQRNLKEAIGSVLLERGDLRSGLAHVRWKSIGEFLARFPSWSRTIDNLERGLALRVLAEIVRIAGWYDPRWRAVHRALAPV